MGGVVAVIYHARAAKTLLLLLPERDISVAASIIRESNGMCVRDDEHLWV